MSMILGTNMAIAEQNSAGEKRPDSFTTIDRTGWSYKINMDKFDVDKINDNENIIQEQ